MYFSSPLKIGNLTLNSRVFQSPLSGVSDIVFRSLVRRYAPDSMVYTEMVSAQEIHHLEKLPQIMAIGSEEQPISIQLFDCRPDFLAEAAQKAEGEGSMTIDINMGCPVNKITKKGGGSSLLRQPELAEAIVRKVVDAVKVPVTVKTRLGWNDQEIRIVELAKRLEGAGASLLTIHGRTRDQGYQGAAQWHWIKQVKEAVSIPVIANGDIMSVDSAVACLEFTGADGVMCSRGTLGYPFLVGEIDSFLKTGVRSPVPTLTERLQVAQDHLEGLWHHKGSRGIYQSRKHLAWYCKGFPGAAKLRQEFFKIDSLEGGREVIGQIMTTIA